MEKVLSYEQQLFAFIERLCGLTINEAHKNYMRSYVNERLKELGMDIAKFCSYIQQNDNECAKLINEAAINETYFFREEQQFDFLINVFFPKFKEKRITIWSAACSTGEEPISLYTLARVCGKIPLVYATDIDTEALSVLEKGKYTNHSFRNDGRKYHQLLERAGKRGNISYELSMETKADIHKSIFNLTSDKPAPVPKGSVNLLFLRNVFIYFSQDLRRSVIRKMSDYLAEGGLLFLSINDIAGTECDDDIPLIKEHVGNIYFFKKVDMETKAKMKKPVLFNSGIAPHHAPNSAPGTAVNRRPLDAPVQRVKNVSAASQKYENLWSNNVSPPIKRNAILRNASPINNTAPPTQSGIEQLAKEIFDDLGRKKIDEAKLKISEYKFRPENLEYRAYFNGLIAEIENDEKGAAQFFLRANLYEPKFWPSYFKLGLIYKKNGNKKESKKTFLMCTNLLEDYVKNNKMCYNFLVEQFSPAYFLDICKKYIED